MTEDTSGYIEVDVKTISETEMAVLLTDGDKEFWVPKSLMLSWPDIEDTGTALIKKWFAIKEELV